MGIECSLESYKIHGFMLNTNVTDALRFFWGFHVSEKNDFSTPHGFSTNERK